MATTRTVRAQSAGPVQLRTKTASLSVRVIQVPGLEFGEVTVSTDDDSGASAEIVRKATVEATGARLNVEVNEGSGGVTVINSGSGHTVMSMGNVAGGIIVAGGSISMVGGRIVSGQGITVVEPGSPITIVARVPAGSSVNSSTRGGGLETTGGLADVSFSSQSGDADLLTVTNANIGTMSGDINISNLTGRAMLKSMSGDITVHGGPGAYAQASSMSGNVTSSGGLEMDGSSMSGRVRNRP